MKKIAMLACGLLTVGTMSAYASNHIAVVDMKKVFNTSPKVQKIKSSLTTEFSGQKKKLEKLQNTLQSDMQSYQKNKTVMSKKDLATLQTKIASEGANFRQEQAKFQQALYAAQTQALEGFMDNVKSVVANIAKKKDVDIVLPKNSVLYNKSDLDLTKTVLAAMK